MSSSLLVLTLYKYLYSTCIYHCLSPLQSVVTFIHYLVISAMLQFRVTRDNQLCVVFVTPSILVLFLIPFVEMFV